MRSWYRTEDGWALWVGLLVVALAVPTAFGLDLIGWITTPQVWMAPGAAVKAASKAHAIAPAWLGVIPTYLLAMGLMGLGAWVQGWPLKRFAAGFTAIFFVSYLCWVAGHYARVAATPDQLGKWGLRWSMGLTGEAGYLIALGAGLLLGNFAPRWAGALKEAARPEWYIKTGIVILGAALGVKAAGAGQLVSAIMFRGLAAIIEAYLIYWALVYLLARTVFKFSREWAAPLASGISICGVSAAITTGAAIRARPVVPVMVSSLVVVFSVVELVALPWMAQAWLSHEPMVAAAWMGLAVKTDGAAVASGAITESLILAQAAAKGIHYEPGWMLTTTTTVKVFIDVFIGIWAFVLAAVWTYGIEKTPGRGLPMAELARRFPKFVLGYLGLFVLMLAMTLARPDLKAGFEAATRQADLLRGLFFVMTFFTIGLAANFKTLRDEGIGRLALVYVLSLFGFIIWIGLAISWLFFHGVMPPLVSGAG